MSEYGSNSISGPGRASRTRPTPRPRPSWQKTAKATAATCSTRFEAGDFPRWTLFIQVMTQAQAKTHRHNPFDLTKVWPKAQYPLSEVGVMELNRWPDNYFAEVEQAALGRGTSSPASASLRTGCCRRACSRTTTRFVTVSVSISIKIRSIIRPKCPFMSYHRDGAMRVDGDLGGKTSFIRTAPGYGTTSPTSPSRRYPLKERRPTTTITPTTITGSSPGIFFG